MKDCRKFYIDRKWGEPMEIHDFAVINPAIEEPIATILLGCAADVYRAVTAAKRSFESYSVWMSAWRFSAASRKSISRRWRRWQRRFHGK
jgi:aldehyde dehydrogenase (NAD+)